MNDEIISISDAAAEAGVPVGVFIAWLVQSGLLIEHPGTTDDRCAESEHVADCECCDGGWIPAPHPDICQLP